MDPQTADEEEFMENTFDAICSALQEPENKDLFNESEGVDLMLIMMRSVAKELYCETQCSRFVQGKVDGEKQGHQSVR
jgi:hypothetical protein